MFDQLPPIADEAEWWEVMLAYSCFGPNVTHAQNGHDVVAEDLFLAEEDFLSERAYTWGCRDTGYVRCFRYDDELVADFGRPWGAFAEHIGCLVEELAVPLIIPARVPGLGSIPYLDAYPVQRDTRCFTFDPRTHPHYRVAFVHDGVYAVHVLDPDDL